MSPVSITRRYRFVAQHCLHSDRLTPEDNRRVFGKCNNPNGHGHNYVLYITVSGAVDPRTGLALDLLDLDRVVDQKIVQRFDHRDLNQDAEFAARTTTGENLVRLIWDLLSKDVPAGRLGKVGIVETRDNYFEYAG